MLPDRVSNPGPLTYESGALPIALRGPAMLKKQKSLSDLWAAGAPSALAVGRFASPARVRKVGPE